MIRRPLLLLAIGVAFCGIAGPVRAEGDAHVDVVELAGAFDQRVIDFAAGFIAGASGQLVVLAIDAPGVMSGDVTPLLDAISRSRVPVAVWVGPAPAEAYGAVAARLLPAAHVRAAAPGARIGYLEPLVAGTSPPEGSAAPGGVAADLAGAVVEVDAPVPGLVDRVEPAVGQLIAGLDGVVIAVTGGEPVVLETAETIDGGDGPVVQSAVEVRFHKPDLLTRFLRLGATPEAAFFLLVAGLLFAAFEFYAAGPGLTAAAAAAALFLAGYGLVVLPVRWWAVTLVVAGVWLLVWEFQRESLGWRTAAGAAALAAGAAGFADTSPQFPMAWWAAALVVVGAVLFAGYALPAVARARFSTRTIGREYLVGDTGVAESGFAIEGFVTVSGARWRARSARTAGIAGGDEIRVVGVDGTVLEVVKADIRE